MSAIEHLHEGAFRIADLCCGAGGAGMGYYRAGFKVVGFDLHHQRNYPFEFRQRDVTTLTAEELAEEFDAVHASFPCQRFTPMQNMHGNSEAHPDLVGSGREVLLASGLPYIIENVEGAPLRADVTLCGTMFGLRIAKHRIFELNWPMGFELLPSCDHSDVYDPWHGAGRTADQFRQAQGTPWIPMAGGASRKEGRTGDLFNAIPPAFTQFLGRHLIDHLATLRLAA